LDAILQATSSIATQVSTRDNAIKEGLLELQELSTSLDIATDALSMIDTTDFPAFDPFAAQLRELTSKAKTASANIMSGIISSHAFVSTTTTAGTDEILLTRQSTSSPRSRRRLHEQRSHTHAKGPSWGSFQQIQDAEINGETGFIEMIAHYQQQATGRFGQGRQLREEVTNTTTEKERQCHLLVDCAGKLSLYDIVVSFYEDDINFVTGEFDRDVDRFFDDGNLLAKQRAIREAVANATSFLEIAGNDKFKPEDACDQLLDQFHRVEENSGASSWIGSSVTEGTYLANAPPFFETCASD
jgi:hypothetical protein